MGMLEIKEARRKWEHKEMKKVIKEIGEYKIMKKEKKLTYDWDDRYEKSKCKFA